MSFDADEIAARLSRRMGIGFTGFVEQIRGAPNLAIRLADLEVPWGFVLLISQTPREIVATFRLDGFAGRVARQMAGVDAHSRETFDSLANLACARGVAVLVEINDETIDALMDAESMEWKNFSLECRTKWRSDLEGRHSTSEVLDLATLTYSLALSLLAPVRDSDGGSSLFGQVEGGPIYQLHQSFERNPVARAIAIEIHGEACQACGMRFVDLYGEIGEGFIEVHHTVPLSAVRQQHVLNPVIDLVPVCCNCHAMLHRTNPPASVDELRESISKLHSNNLLVGGSR